MLSKLTYQHVAKWAVIFFGLLIVTLVALPMAIQLGIAHALSNMGVEKASVGDVDFNPFLGRLVVKNLKAETKNIAPLSLEEARLELSWRSLWNRRIVFENIMIKGLRVDVLQTGDGRVNIAGMAFPAAEKSSEQPQNNTVAVEPAWGFGIRQFQLGVSDVAYHSEKLNLALRVDSFTLNSLLSFVEAIPAVASFVGSVNGAPMQIALQATPFLEPRYVKGDIHLQALELAAFNQSLPPMMQQLKGQLGVNINLKFEQHKSGDFKLGVYGGAQLAGLDLKLPEQKLDVLYESLRWQGGINLVQEASQIDWLVDGNVESAGSVVMQHVGDKKVPLFVVESVDMKGLHISPMANVVDDIQLTSVKVQLAKTKDGSMQLPAADTASPGDDVDKMTKSSAEQKASTPTSTIKLRHIKITGDSAVVFEDNSVAPPFRLTIQLDDVVLSDVDNTQPELPTTISMKGKLDEFSSFSVSGKLYPFSVKPSVDLAGNINSLELPPLSSYTVPVLGYNLASGQLDADLHFKVDKGVISSQNKLKLNQLTLEPSDPDAMAKFSKQLSMPLDAALSLLRDKNDNIQFKLPIDGDLDNPNFDVADAINQSLSTAMKFAAMSYIKFALQPFGALVKIYQVADSAGKMVSAVRLDPVNFNQGSSLLDGGVADYLDSAINLLVARPNISLKICGMATRADLSSLLKGQDKGDTQQESGPFSAEAQNALLTLARERSLAVKSYLVKKGGVAADKLFICYPEIDYEESAAPRVELRI